MDSGFITLSVSGKSTHPQPGMNRMPVLSESCAGVKPDMLCVTGGKSLSIPFMGPLMDKSLLAPPNSMPSDTRTTQPKVAQPLRTLHSNTQMRASQRTGHQYSPDSAKRSSNASGGSTTAGMKVVSESISPTAPRPVDISQKVNRPRGTSVARVAKTSEGTPRRVSGGPVVAKKPASAGSTVDAMTRHGSNEGKENGKTRTSPRENRSHNAEEECSKKKALPLRRMSVKSTGSELKKADSSKPSVGNKGKQKEGPPMSKSQSGWEKIKDSINDDKKDLYKYVAITGNSTFLVRNAMKNRPWWTRAPDHDSLFMFKWKPTSHKLKFDMIGKSQKQCVNHLEGHHALTTKARFFQNMKAFYEKEGMDVFENIPVTYAVNVANGVLDKDWMAFNRQYQYILKSGSCSKKSKKSESEGLVVDESLKRETRKVQATGKKSRLTGETGVAQYSISRNGVTNIWIVKPVHLNRGKGVKVFTDIEDIKKYVFDSDGMMVIQKYLERPLLIHRRKFDIRCYVLISMVRGFEVFFYADGYLRTASDEFDNSNTNNRMAHLTNNAVQKKATSYGEHEEGNMMTYDAFQEYIDEEHGGAVNVIEDLVPKMKELVLHSALAVRKELNPNNLDHSFELFGYDFMVDESFKLWLIEVNTNPCLELVSDVVRDLLPKLIEDIIQLTVDPIFPPPRTRKWPKWPPAGHRSNGFTTLYSDRDS